MKIRWPELVWCLGLCLLAGVIGSFFTAPAIPVWYAGLVKPVFTPPSWLFAPVWTVLYVLMGISLYLVRIHPPLHKNPHRAEVLFSIQLFLNILWSVIFFGLQNPIAALLEITLLLLAIILTWDRFREISPTASGLLIPYILWVSFATCLNLAIVVLN